MNRMREEMWRLRMAVLSLVPEKFRTIVNPPYKFSSTEGFQWEHTVTGTILQMLETDAGGRSACPLCGETTQTEGVGFSIPTGLERHLLGSHKSHQCVVMYAAKGLLRVRHRELYPEEFGPYGCD